MLRVADRPRQTRAAMPPMSAVSEWEHHAPRTTLEEAVTMASSDEIVDQIAGFALFADLTTPQLERIAHMFEEEVHPEGTRVLRQGLSGSAFHIILDGEAAVVIDGQQRSVLSRGDFFGEVSILLGEPPGADIIASRAMRTLVLPGSAVKDVLLDNPPLMYRMLQAQARRLRNANRWRS